MPLAGPAGCWVPTLEVVVDAVLFDFGGVITSSPFEAFATYEAEAGLPAGTIRLLNATNPDENAWARLERNEVDRAGFADLFDSEAAALGFEVDAARVLAALEVPLRPEMVEAVRRWPPPCLPTTSSRSTRGHIPRNTTRWSGSST